MSRPEKKSRMNSKPAISPKPEQPALPPKVVDTRARDPHANDLETTTTPAIAPAPIQSSEPAKTELEQSQIRLEAQKTLKSIDDERPQISPNTPPGKRGPGRPRKDSAKGDVSAKTETERPSPSAAQPGLRKSDSDLTTRAVRGILQAAASIEGALAALMLKIEIGKAVEIWRFSELELDLISEPATRFANKYAPDWLIKHHDEIELAGILGPIMLNKIYAMLLLKNPELLAKLMAAASGKPSPQQQPGGKVSPMRPPSPAPRPAPRTEPERPKEAAAAGADDPNPAAIPAGGPEFLS